MRKISVVGGVVVLAVLAGWGGVRFLEDRVEKNIVEAFVAAGGQVREADYHLLDNILVLQGMTYEVRERNGAVRTGAVERVVAEGMNRRMLLDWYAVDERDREEPPLVAEQIVLTGMTETLQDGPVRVDQRAGKIRIRGWRQRLGRLLYEYRLKSCSSSFFEELYRCRLDGLEISRVELTLSRPGLAAPVRMNVEKVALSEGLNAPRGETMVSSLSLEFSGLSISGQGINGFLRRAGIRELRLPEPEALAELAELLGRKRPGEELVAGMLELWQKQQEAALPYASLTMQDMKLVSTDMPVGVFFEGFSSALSMEGEGVRREKTEYSRLRFLLPRKGDKYFTIIARYAPDGLVLTVKTDSVMTGTSLSCTGRCEVETLGVVEGEWRLSGDAGALKELKDVFFFSSGNNIYEVLQKRLVLEKLNASCNDSGLLPMMLELVAWRNFERPEVYADKVLETGRALEQNPDRGFRELGRLLREQFTAPGTCSMTFSSEEPVELQAFVGMFFRMPEKFPFTFTSVPGTKPLKEYLNRK
ncbi:hypothetical protein [Mailhella massiliensis]|uniref:hypothetical protein n=1 Tax=Mailhella massiliensis TaxID=1903261 RepID=UPI002353879C|nr:hypothetical protein [Mailhella massiliensis]